VSAANRDLQEAIAKAQFREDLFYRVNIVTIELPSLQERAGDVRMLAQAFLKRYGKEHVRGIDGETMTTLERYHWQCSDSRLRRLRQRLEGLPCVPSRRR
jgi:two-component system NtrC family response regulator